MDSSSSFAPPQFLNCGLIEHNGLFNVDVSVACASPLLLTSFNFEEYPQNSPILAPTPSTLTFVPYSLLPTAPPSSSPSPAPSSSRSISPQEKDEVKIQSFIAKLAFLLHREEYADVIRWDSRGSSFVVSQKSLRFQEEVLPTFFGHSNPASFRRQLNVYGFTRVPTTEMLDIVRLASFRPLKDVSVWRHPGFSRHCSELALSKLQPRPSRARMEKAAAHGTKIMS